MRAKRCCEKGTRVLKERNDLETSVLIGQIQSTAMDLLRASGMEHSESREALREAARHAYEEEPAAGN